MMKMTWLKCIGGVTLLLLFSPIAGGGGDNEAEAETSMALPAEFSWGDKDGVNWMTPVRYMEQCGGSICAFAAIGALEPRLRIVMEDPTIDVDLSEQHVLSCDTETCDMCAMDYTLDFIRDHGVADEACFPYVGSAMACEPCTDVSSRLVAIDSWTKNEAPTVAAMKAEIFNNGPLVTRMDIYDDFLAYAGGVYSYTSGILRGSTNVVLYGWDDSESCWLAKNHWGTSNWGEVGPDGTLGWFRISMGTNEVNCESTFYAMTPTPPALFNDGFESGDFSEWSASVP